MGSCHTNRKSVMIQHFINSGDIHNFKLYLENNFSENLILSCLENDKAEFLKVFLYHPNSNPNIALSKACQKCQNKIVGLLLRDKRTLITFEVLKYIILNNKIKLLRILMRNPLFDPCIFNNFALKNCIKLDHYESFCLLTRHKLFLTENNINFAIRYASLHYRKKMVSFLLYTFGRA